MSSTLVVKPRRFRVTLWSANDKFDPEGEISEVISVKTNFALGQIPMAAVELPHGEEVHTGEVATASLEVPQLVASRSPVCIIVERIPLPMHATVSTLNDDDPECKWPKDPVVIFKGYASAFSFVKAATTIGTVLHIQHWLCDLSAVSAYCPRSHCSNPTAFGIDINSFPLNNSGDLTSESRHWALVTNTLSSAGGITGAKEGVWSILKKLFENLCKASLKTNKTAIGGINESYINKMLAALGRFRPHIDWHEDVKPAASQLSNDIVAAIGSNIAATWMNTTIWDELAGSMSGMFYFSIVPTVNNAHIIPRPGAVAKDCIELNENDLFSFSMDIPTTPILDACILAYQNGTERVYSKPSFVIGPMYPERREDGQMLSQTKGGPIAVTSAPAWLQVRTTLMQIKSQRHIAAPVHKLSPKPGMPAAKVEWDKMDTAIEKVARQLVRFDYFSKVFAGRSAKFSMPIRADICPGACVHIKIDPVIKMYGGTVDIYGTVEMVMLDMDDQHANTIVMLNNIRSKDEFESDVFNGGPVFYNEIWTGKGVPIYGED